MSEEAVVALIKDFTAKLSAVAEQIGERNDHGHIVPVALVPTDGDMANAQRAQRLIDQRRSRRRFLPAELFHEPAWEMLLALYVSHEEGRVMNVKGLVACADAPVTTSQRWIEHLAKLQLVTRGVDAVDRRRVEVSLTPAGVDAIRAYLEAMG